MNNIIVWFETMDPTLRIYWYIALFSSFFFLIQITLTFIGIGDHDADLVAPDSLDVSDGDAIETGDAMQLFTIRNIINFLLGVGWGGVCFWDDIPMRPLLALVAILCGCAFVALFLLMLRQMKKLESNGAFRIQECLGKNCQVYLRIPASRQGLGKIQISVHGSIHEIPAMTDNEEPIPSGTPVQIVEIIHQNTLLVTKVC